MSEVAVATPLAGMYLRRNIRLCRIVPAKRLASTVVYMTFRAGPAVEFLRRVLQLGCPGTIRSCRSQWR